MLIDTHCHISSRAFDGDREEAYKRAREAGVGAMVAIGAGYGTGGNAEAVEFARTHEGVYAAVGIHPHEAKEASEQVYADLVRLARENPGKVVGWGEIGLDYYYEHSDRKVQREVFGRMIDLAIEVNLPIIIHDRDAGSECADILRSHGADKVGGVWHCFTGDYDAARRALDLGFLLSIPGIVTFRNADMLRDVIRRVPVECLVVETDSPFLAPVPWRGKRNEPAYVRKVAEKIAELKAPLTADDIERITTRNAIELFDLKDLRPAAETPQIAYSIRNSLYLNITNRCTNPCFFCPKFGDWTVKGHYLRLGREPSLDELKAAVGDPSKWDEVVFVGLGEPTNRLDLLKETARWLKEKGARKIRLDTDGMANLVYGRNVAPELGGLIDAVSVSLNAQNASEFARVTRTPYKEEAWPKVKEFIAEAKKVIPWVQATVVTVPGVDVEACRRIAEDELGVRFRAREYNEVG
ncbi:MAG: YchF/TatD family DNA exonuclease [Deltaproteobacteria bacterium]|nr:YchF/TatD family DNA exonuclease [Deltaproteobacteria bacterium]